MKMKNLLLVLIWSVGLVSCGGSKDSEHKYTIEGQSENGFEDGTYCANVTYYNPNTPTKSDYILKVDVAGNKVVKINFGNGGWLDSDHITPKTLDANGKCSITTDRDYVFAIKITGKNCNVSSSFVPNIEYENTKYTFEECAQKYNLSKDEKAECAKTLGYSDGTPLTESACSSLGNYVNELRDKRSNNALAEDKINSELQEKQNVKKEKQSNLKNEINNGFIQKIQKCTAYGNLNQFLIASKNGTYYLLQDLSQNKLTMGIIDFNENASGNQEVWIKQYPNKLSFTGHMMKVIGSYHEMWLLEDMIQDRCFK
jgi:hypothetical protein